MVIGNAIVASDAIQDSDLAKQGLDYGYSLVASAIGYLREKPSHIGIAPKKGDSYSLNADRDTKDRMVLEPFAYMSLGLLGLGLGIWTVRRR